MSAAVRLWFLAAAAAFVVVAMAAAAWAQPIIPGQPRQACADRAEVIKRLAEVFGETLQSIGLAGDDSFVEVYASAATGTWTILNTRPNGMACLLASGEMWEGDVQPLDPVGAPL